MEFSSWAWLFIVLVVVGFISLIIGGILLSTHRDVSPTPGYIWFFIIFGFILLVIAAVILIFLYYQEFSWERTMEGRTVAREEVTFFNL